MKIFTPILLAISLQFFAMNAQAVKSGEIFRDWKVQCSDPANTSDSASCHIFQNLVSKDKNRRILHIGIGYVEGKDNPAAIITLPLGVSLQPGLTLGVDGNKPKLYAYQACFKSGCQAGFPLDNKLLNAFRSGKKAAVTIYDLRKEAVLIHVSLSGFSAALDAINPNK